MAINHRSFNVETGWPVVNYGSEERNFHSLVGPLSIPRFKFTYLVEFKINPRVIENPVTNIQEFLSNGKIYTQLKVIDHPKPEMKYETLRSYNKWIKVPTIMEFQGGSMTFDDDSTSVTQALWKEYMNFYSHLATIGENDSAGTFSNLSSSDSNSEYQYTHRLTGEEMRSGMGRRPSLGMKLKPNDMRHFFESIIIYDLGTEPDAVNVYWFYHPVITSWDHQNLDKEDRAGKVEVTANFEYESYYWTFGQNRGRIRDYIQTILGFFPNQGDSIPRKSGIGRQAVARNRSQSVGDLDNVSSIFVDNPELGSLVSDLPNVLTFPAPESELNEFTEIPEEPILNSQTQPTFPSSIDGKQAELRRIEEEQEQEQLLGATDADSLKKRARLEEKKEQLTDALTTQREQQRSSDLKDKNTQSALENTKAKTNAEPVTKSPVIRNSRADVIIKQAENAVDRIQNEIGGLNSQISEFKTQREEAVARGDNRTAQNITNTITQQQSRIDKLLIKEQEAIDKALKLGGNV